MLSFWGRAAVISLALILPSCAVRAQVSADRIVRAAAEPQNWLTYAGTYDSKRYSKLSEINPTNVKQLEVKWMLQAQVAGVWEAHPLVVNGIMYLTQRPNDVVAVDVRTGRALWIYHYANSSDAKVCCQANNRGVAILGNTLFMGTLDAHLVAIDARTGVQLWNKSVADPKQGYGMSGAPLIVKSKVVVGLSGGDFGIRGFLAAYDPENGNEVWRFNTIPQPGEPEHESWSGDWEHGGGATWITGSYDPQLNLIYWGVGNPGPDWNPAQRKGDNLYSNSVVALDADTGELKWYFQFTPNDGYDYDATQTPVLVDLHWRGTPRKLMLWANRNGFFYVLDRSTGEYLLGKPFIPVNWASGLDAKGRPIQTPPPDGAPVYPGIFGGTNWYGTSYSARTGLFYLSAWENYAVSFRREQDIFKPGQPFVGGGAKVVAPTPNTPTPAMGRQGPLINGYTDEVASGAVIAINPRTGTRAWTYKMFDVTDGGVLSTASNLVFSGNREGFFFALDAETGKPLWHVNLGGPVAMAPMTYQIDGKQYLTVIAGNSLVTFGLRN